MRNSKSLLKMITLSMLIALGVVISPILRVEGMCPMAHFINIVCFAYLVNFVGTAKNRDIFNIGIML